MSPQAKIGWVSALVGVAMVAVVSYAMLQQAQVTCEACVTFHGRTQCRTAVGPDEEEARRTAVDNACGLLASGMADSISCSNTQPDRLVCE